MLVGCYRGAADAPRRKRCHEVEKQYRYVHEGLIYLGFDMAAIDTVSEATAVTNELVRMRGLGYFVVDEAFECARDFDVSDFAGLSVSSLAFIACERGHAAYKSRLRSGGMLTASAK